MIDDILPYYEREHARTAAWWTNSSSNILS